MTEATAAAPEPEEPGADVVELHRGEGVEPHRRTSIVGGVSVDRDLLKRTICHDLTDDELDLFVAVCNRTGLDPFAKQIYAIKRNDRNAPGGKKMGIQTSIDGFRLIAERSGRYAGQMPLQWTADGETWVDVWLATDPPAAARAGVYKVGFAEPLVRPATWSQYAQMTNDGKPTRMWAQMPALMLAKCAEALALRAAFPAELSGLYTDDEMQQAEYVGARGGQRAIAAPSFSGDDPADVDVLMSLAMRVMALPEEQRDELASTWKNVDRLHGITLRTVPINRVQLVESMIRGVETKAAKADSEWSPEAALATVRGQIVAGILAVFHRGSHVDGNDAVVDAAATADEPATSASDDAVTSAEGSTAAVVPIDESIMYPLTAPEPVDSDNGDVLDGFDEPQIDAVIAHVRDLDMTTVNKALRAHEVKLAGAADNVRRQRLVLALLREVARQSTSE